jgi:hypothetical protein
MTLALYRRIPGFICNCSAILSSGQAGPLDQFLLLTLGANRSAKSGFFGLKIFSATNEAIHCCGW